MLRRLILALCLALTGLAAPVTAQTPAPSLDLPSLNWHPHKSDLIRPGRSPGFRPGITLFQLCSPIPGYTGTPLYQSLALTDTWATTNAALVTNNVVAPVCTTTAALLTENSATGVHNVGKSPSVTITTGAHTLTAYAKRVTGSRNLDMNAQDSTFSSGIGAQFNLGTCAVNSSFSFGSRFSSVTVTATSVSGGWCKLQAVITYASSDTGIYIPFDMLNSTFTSSYAGDGASSIALWGVDFR
jgi:hypothetical protein